MDLLRNVVAKILLRASWEFFHTHCATGPCEGCEQDWPSQRDHRCMGFPTRMNDADVVAEHLPAARRHLNIPAVIGLYLDLLCHQKLCPRNLVQPTTLLEQVLDHFEADPLDAIQYSYGCEREVCLFINSRISNLELFCAV